MNDLLLRTLRCEPTERRPLWVMRQAGRYLPEYRALRQRHSFEELSTTPELAAEVTLMPIERFPLDGAIVFADLMSPVAALGVEVRFDPGPVTDRTIRSRADLATLAEPQAGQIAPEVCQTLALVRERLEGRATLLGFAGAPWSVAAYMVEGRGRRDFPALRALAASEPGVLDELLARLTDLAALYLADQARAGAQAVQIFDSWAGMLSPRTWRRVVRPHLMRLLEKTASIGVPRILFLHGAPHLIEEMIELPAEAFSFDWRVDLEDVRRRLGPDRAVQGNLDPAILTAGPEATAAAARDLLARVEARGHVVNLGHGITPDAPIESVEALVQVVQEEGR